LHASTPNASHSIQGSFDDRISLMIYLTDLDVSGNNFTGEIGRGVLFLPQIARLNLANNRFTGTIDTALQCAPRGGARGCVSG
jgi:hypothetical protein